jgi:uncharacterized RmlC-like cupin family protein
MNTGTSRGIDMTDRVRRIAPEDLDEATGTPGIVRKVAHETPGYWFGNATAAADTMSGWHHHGQNTTLGFVLKGHFRIEFGPGGADSVDLSAGDYFVVPPGTVHREGNATDEPGEAVIVRVGEGPPVFPADGPDPA